MSAITDLAAKVEANITVTESAITLIQGLKAALDQAVANSDLSAVADIANHLGAETDKLAAAVSANSPTV